MQASTEMRRAVRHLGRKVRGGVAAPDETQLFERLDRAMNYLSARRQRSRRGTRWWHTPVAARMWAEDGREIGA